MTISNRIKNGNFYKIEVFIIKAGYRWSYYFDLHIFAKLFSQIMWITEKPKQI
jgi:hypothetical protein